MPLSTALPPQQIEVLDSYFFPAHPITAAPGQNSLAQLNWQMRNETTPVGEDGALYGGVGGIGGTVMVAGNSFGSPGSVFSCRCITTVNSIGGGFQPPFARPSYGPASAWGAGAVTAPANVVSTYSVQWALTDASDNWPQDTTGFTFVPFGNPMTSNFVDSLRVGSSPLNGFGLFFNPDGAGAAQVDYMAWSGAAVLERVTVPAGTVSDATDWNSLTFAIISAGSGREATMSLTVNGVSIVSGRVFGSADLAFPGAVDDRALQYAFGISATAGGGEGYYYLKYGYDGRFTPAGLEVQPFGA